MSTYQHALAYLLGLEGLALLRGWAGDFDEAFTRSRLCEVRQLLDDPMLSAHPGVTAARGTTIDGYQQWSASYDEPNGLFDVDEPFVYGIVDRLPAGVALDAACGTGRFSEGLARRGHQVIGVDSSPDMLALARRRVPDARFESGDLTQLPLPVASVDMVVCALALAHLPSLDPVMTEFARVLRPGGHLIVSDVHHELILRGSVVTSMGPNGEPRLVPTYRHTPGAFLRAALPQGFLVRSCEEPGATPGGEVPAGEPAPAPSTVRAELGQWKEWPWSLMEIIPAACDAAWQIPFTINWHFQLGNE